MFKYLYAPWRSTYTQDTVRGKSSDSNSDECVFCTQLASEEDEKHFVLARYQHCAVFMNLYPYNAGHLLVIPYEHKAQLTDLPQDAYRELMDVIVLCTKQIQKTLKTDAYNIGFNIGKNAGAGIPAHLHGHVLPRWHGDTNFLPTLAETKQISVDIPQLYQQLKADWSE